MIPTILPADLPTLARLRDEHERIVLEARLVLCGWNETLTAETLGISRSQIRNLRAKHGLIRSSSLRPLVRNRSRAA